MSAMHVKPVHTLVYDCKTREFSEQRCLYSWTLLIGTLLFQISNFKLKIISLGFTLQSVTIGYFNTPALWTIPYFPWVFKIVEFNCTCRLNKSAWDFLLLLQWRHWLCSIFSCLHLFVVALQLWIDFNWICYLHDWVFFVFFAFLLFCFFG